MQELTRLYAFLRTDEALNQLYPVCCTAYAAEHLKLLRLIKMQDVLGQGWETLVVNVASVWVDEAPAGGPLELLPP